MEMRKLRTFFYSAVQKHISSRAIYTLYSMQKEEVPKHTHVRKNQMKKYNLLAAK